MKRTTPRRHVGDGGQDLPSGGRKAGPLGQTREPQNREGR